VCLGLDTVADVTINGQLVLSANNMFRTWTVDVKSALQAV
jgi:beta-mannosidase